MVASSVNFYKYENTLTDKRNQYYIAVKTNENKSKFHRNISTFEESCGIKPSVEYAFIDQFCLRTKVLPQTI